MGKILTVTIDSNCRKGAEMSLWLPARRSTANRPGPPQDQRDLTIRYLEGDTDIYLFKIGKKNL